MVSGGQSDHRCIKPHVLLFSKSGSAQSFLETRDEVHPFVQDGENERGLFWARQAEKDMPSGPPRAQAGDQFIQSFEGSLSKGQFTCGGFDPGDIGSALRFSPLFKRVTDDAAQIPAAALRVRT